MVKEICDLVKAATQPKPPSCDISDHVIKGYISLWIGGPNPKSLLFQA